MLFFTKKHKILKSGILNGKTDIHSHLVPGVDDGSPDMEHTMDLLYFMDTIGYRHLILTPHVMDCNGNNSQNLRERFNELKSHYEGVLTLDLGAEYMLDSGFHTHLENGPLRLGKEHLLVETSYFSGPLDMYDLLFKVWNMGYKPLIAHPERYNYMELDDYANLKAKGYDFQLNLLSLTGYYGARPKEVATDLLEQEMYDFVGTDLHHVEHYQMALNEFKLPTKQLDQLEQLLVNNENV